MHTKHTATWMKHLGSFVKDFKPLFLTAIILVSFCGVSYASIHYVSPSGTAMWEESTNINTSCSASTAMLNASAGDIVYFRGGIYNLGEDSSYHGSLEPSNSGSSGSPITFAAYIGETPVLNGTVRSGSYLCHVLATNSKDYIVFDGFRCQADDGHKAGGILIWGEGATTSDNCIVRNCIIDGGNTIIISTDNIEGIRCDNGDNNLIQRCEIYNFRQSSDHHNTSAIKMYSTTATIIENCEIYDCSCGLYPKNGNNECIYRYNYIHDNHLAVFIASDAGSSSDDCKFYHNVVANNTYSAYSAGVESPYHSDDWEIHNNTIYNSIRGISFSPNQANHGWKIYNNIIEGCTNKQFTGLGGATIAECGHNQFGSASLLVTMRLYESNKETYSSLSSWQSSGELEGGGNPGEGSLASDPKFANSSGNMNKLDDFRIAPDSPCKDTGRGGVDMGADISLVGARGGDVLAAPQNLEIVSAK